jgi:hypothetical protein
MHNIDWAIEFATRVEEDEVWNYIGKAQLKKGLSVMQLSHLSRLMMLLNSMKSSIKLLMSQHMCRNPSFGLATKAKGVARVRA